MQSRPSSFGRARKFAAGAVLLLALATDAGHADDSAIFVTGPAQPTNVGDAILAAATYHDSGAYDRDIEGVLATASNWIAERAPAVAKPALVLDIDETTLSNWEVIQRDNFGRPIGGGCEAGGDGPCGWAAWDQLGQSKAIAPMQTLFHAARAAKVAVFFITGRPEDQRAATDRNLKETGFDGFEKLYMTPNGAKFSSAANFKTPVRQGIEAAGFTIIANIGDQPSDILGGHAERIYLLPNPFYRVR